ncbi:protein phosphatase 2C domain-containing protein [Bacillus sp. FJAT-49711]|uniref:PP2C family serine/threonine-protein phosphatase n=1 Tax=Bacillus sp. FJAT-49711 TaxID=2833585 RepID=UPI001BC8D23F|nr:PP2C family serine/threonine-protein phosphatase [Bacillus sp. FJAT-49711]MBS4219432.1 protein phosphatase 2C domain-containing protein [Bacillus sp. FJAT-49711]
MIHLENEYSEVHAFQTAKDSNVLCGDSFYLTLNEDYVLCALADGLGSGKYAHEASQAAVSVVRSNPEESVDTLMDFCNKVLLRKRGAAVAIFKVDFKKKEFEYSCVGNIRFYMYTPAGKLIYPMPVTGYLSGRPQKYRTQKYSYESKSKFLIHTDGFVNVNTKDLLNGCQSIPALVAHLKAKQVNTSDDMSFIVGTLL